MGRTLVLMRHATAEGWGSNGDKGRELTGRGRQEATEAGVQLRPLGIQHVLCSTAVRTRQTLECLGLEAPVEYMDALYDCSAPTMAQRIGEIDDEVTSLLVVGPSPAVPTLAAELTWSSDQKAADDIQCWYPTATFSQFSLDGSWRDLLEDRTLRLSGVRRVGR